MTTTAQHHVVEGDLTDSIHVLREAVAHSYDADDMMSNVSATGVAVLALAELGRDDAAATCAGALAAGAFAPFSLFDGIVWWNQSLADLGDRLGTERYDAASARGAAADYGEIVAFMLATFDDILHEMP